MRRLISVAALLLLVVVPAHAATKHAPSLGEPTSAWFKAYGHYLSGTTKDNPGWLACGKRDSRWQVLIAARARHVYAIYGAFCGNNPPSVAARIKIAMTHMPADSIKIGKHDTGPGNGVDLVYFSDTLAHEGGFIRGDFLDCDYNLVRPGTFSLNLEVPSAIDWTMQLGTCA